MTGGNSFETNSIRPSSRARWLTALFVISAFLAVGIIGLNLKAACACSPTQPPVPASPVLGVVTSVDSPSLGKVKGFTLRETASGLALVFTLGLLENATEFSPSHLSEHMASSEPVRVFFRLENGQPVVYRIEDAST